MSEKKKRRVDSNIKIRMMLRSVYLKGHQDGNNKTADMSWENLILKDLSSALCGELEKQKNIRPECKEASFMNEIISNSQSVVKKFFNQDTKE